MGENARIDIWKEVDNCSNFKPAFEFCMFTSRDWQNISNFLFLVDKAQLLEIAKANAAAMCAKAGVPLPPNLMPVITPEKKEEKVIQKSAKETILELTEVRGTKWNGCMKTS